MEEIAKDYVGISVEAFRKWRIKNPDIRKAIDTGTEICNAQIEKALFKRAIGYDYWEETWELIEGEMTLIRKQKRHMPPETKAILQWLFNKLPNQWRAIQEPLEATGYKDTIKEILVAMKEVAERQQISLKYLERILPQLVEARLVGESFLFKKEDGCSPVSICSKPRKGKGNAFGVYSW